MAVPILAGIYGCPMSVEQQLFLCSKVSALKDRESKVEARRLHPPLAIGMTVFFALGGLGGLSSLVVQNKPIFER